MAARRAAGAAEVVAAASSEAGRAPALACRSSLRYAPRAPWLSLAAATATRDRALCGVPQATRRCGEAWRATEADGRLVAPLGASHAGSGLGGGRCSSGDEGGLASRLCAAPIGGSRGLRGNFAFGNWNNKPTDFNSASLLAVAYNRVIIVVPCARCSRPRPRLPARASTAPRGHEESVLYRACYHT